MSLVAVCKNCGRKISGRDEVAGRQFRCPGCHAVGQFPQPGEPSPAGRKGEVCPVCGFDLWVDADQIQDARGQRFHRTCFEEVRPKRKPQALPDDEVQIFQAGEPAAEEAKPTPRQPAAKPQSRPGPQQPAAKPRQPLAKQDTVPEDLGLAPLPEAEPKKPAAAGPRPGPPRPAEGGSGPQVKPEPARPAGPRPKAPAAVAGRSAASQAGAIALRCRFCGHRFKAPARLSGKIVHCPECDDEVRVPAPAPKPESKPNTLPAAVLQTPPEAEREAILASLPDALPENETDSPPPPAPRALPEATVVEPSAELPEAIPVDPPEDIPEAVPIAGPAAIPEALPVAMPADDPFAPLPAAMPADPFAPAPLAPAPGQSKQPGWFYAVVGIGAAVPAILVIFIIIHMATRPDTSRLARTDRAAAQTDETGSAGSTSQDEYQEFAAPDRSSPRPRPSLRRPDSSSSRSPTRGDVDAAYQTGAVIGMVIGALLGAIMGAVPLKLSCVVLGEKTSFLKCMGITLITGVINFCVGLALGFVANKSGTPALDLLALPIGFLIFTAVISGAMEVEFGRGLLIALLATAFAFVIVIVLVAILGAFGLMLGIAAHSAAGAVI